MGKTEIGRGKKVRLIKSCTDTQIISARPSGTTEPWKCGHNDGGFIMHACTFHQSLILVIASGQFLTCMCHQNFHLPNSCDGSECEFVRDSCAWSIICLTV